jgi:tricarballylate dehydrogenase
MKNATFDVVVVGCGIAGLSAAVMAAEKGLKTAILERATFEERGGQSRYTEAYLRMCDFDKVSDDFEMHLAENSGFYQDPDFISEMALDRSSWSAQTAALPVADTNVLEAFSDSVAPTLRWLEAAGVKFEFLPTQFLTKSQPRLLPVGGGQAVVDALAARAEQLGVEFFYETAGRELVVDAINRVTGIKAFGRVHGALQLNGNVVLASGGFEGNAEMLARYLGPRSVYLRPVCKGGFYNRGEGIEMALRIGAAPCGEFGSYHAEPVDPRSGVSEPSIFIFPYGILVNKEGARFTDEAAGTVDAWYERVTRQIYEQTEGIAYVILDERVKDVPNYRLAIRTDQPAFAAPSIGELARKIGVSAARLEQTVAAYNAACQSGTYRPLELDGVATAGLEPPKSNWALPLDQGPFTAYPIVSANVFTFGGIKVDANGQVINCDGLKVDGLFAAGETVGMYFGNYTGGTSVLKAMVFGRLSAMCIAENMARRHD